VEDWGPGSEYDIGGAAHMSTEAGALWKYTTTHNSCIQSDSFSGPSSRV